jgi:hypothetical protein
MWLIKILETIGGLFVTERKAVPIEAAMEPSPGHVYATYTEAYDADRMAANRSEQWES